MSYEKSFIEVQFPVSKISKESYKERKAVQSQTLTGLGKWWGRKPLILVRAVILGILMPATSNLQKDRDIFLKILNMDEKGLLKRKVKSIPPSIVYKYLNNNQRLEYFENDIKYRCNISKDEKEQLQRTAFQNMNYDDKLIFCEKAEVLIDKSKEEWNEINNHLGTSANSFQELIKELGSKVFGNNAVIGDCFCGGGSIPFEAARSGCDTYASDLNPIAVLLTWAEINILGLPKKKQEEINSFLELVYNNVSNEMRQYEINKKNEKAIAYLYCTEVECSECNWVVPVSPSWVVGERAGRVVAKLEENNINRSFNIRIISDVTKEEINKASESGTVKNGSFVCSHCGATIPISSLRKDKKGEDGRSRNSIRQWELDDLIPREDDVFRERLYAIRWEREDGTRYYGEITEEDIELEIRVMEDLVSKSKYLNEKGILPNGAIEEGYNTSQPIFERGWRYWRNLFNPRQQLINSLVIKNILDNAKTVEEYAIATLALNRCCDYNSKLSRWDVKTDTAKQTFYNQAFNTLFNYASRSWYFLRNNWYADINWQDISMVAEVEAKDARTISKKCDIWITDPPYADAVNYHELSEFFIAWNKILFKKIFNGITPDSKRLLAVKGVGEDFNISMVEIYKNLTNNMSDNGIQVVMFTHQNVSVWANLTNILWSAGLCVTAAWNIATETEASGLKNGNYVKGTVLLVLRKQISNETAYLDELYAEVQEEVKLQIDSMRNLDDKEDPNFSDPDYLLAAYAASLKVLTSYKKIEDIDVEYELKKNKNINEKSAIENIIDEAVKIAYDYLIPNDFDTFIWKTLTPQERLYIKGMELEKQNIYQLSAYQELARGFGVSEYTDMLGSTKANTARLKTPKEFAMKNLNDSSAFGNSLLRNILVAIHLGLKEEDTSKGRNWLKTEVTDYWNKRSSIIEILNYLSKTEYIDNMEHWRECAHEAFILKNLVENDNI